MVRRVAAAVVAGAMVCALPGSAAAAEGRLTLSGKTYVNPQPGCYTGLYVPLLVGNGTDTPVLVFADRACRGDLIGEVAPGDNRVFEFGGSVQVPG
ncbi:hypothetical protein [Streptomyces carpaticus]|uniref:Uncharacterized protein n=1 Tax=Streptomyces carpaticus TaxID=285558 RepID=A0ABV4ZL16_9ACTN